METLINFAEVTTSELEKSITGLCADLNAATYRQLAMIAEFDNRRGWGDDGVRSCAHWLNWRCGISFVAAREKIRVAHALKKLPNTRLAFASGELSYSKARAITRVGTPHNEDCLLSYARYGSASHLDKVVRLYRKQYDSAGQFMADYQTPLFAPDVDDDTDGDVDACADVDPASPSDEQRFAAENEGAMHKHDYRQLSSYWDEYGCLIIRARLTEEQGAVVIKAMDTAMEELKAAEPSGDYITAAAQSTTADPAECESESSVEEFRIEGQRASRRRADALVAMAEALLKDTKVASATDDRYQVVVNVDSKVLAKEVFEKPDGSPDCYIDGQVALPVETARRLSCSCKIVTTLTRGGEPLSVGRSTRAVSLPIRRALNLRDGHCVFPGCDCRKHLDAHHIVHWANGGETSLNNLILVCHYHHKLLHEGQYSVKRLSDGQLLFTNPKGNELRHEPVIRDETECVTRLTDVNAEPWSWCGDTMDYSMALSALAAETREALKNAEQLDHRVTYRSDDQPRQ